MRVARLIGCVAALAAVLAIAPSARADEYNKLTYLTFSGPVQIPGATLAAGTYMFKLADTMADRHIVQVFDKNGTKLYATLLAVPDYRIDTPDKNIVMFAERPAGTPQAVKAWWYPGDNTGDEFVYPRAQAMKIARANHEPVLSSNEKMGDRGAMKSAHVGHINERGEPADANTAATTTSNANARNTKSGNAPAASTTAATTTPDQHAAATSGTKTPAATDRDRDRTNNRTATTTSGNTAANTAAPARHLPKTASPLGLFELLSAAAFAGAAGTRQLRKRLAARAA
jgi:hypothetical protein